MRSSRATSTTAPPPYEPRKPRRTLSESSGSVSQGSVSRGEVEAAMESRRIPPDRLRALLEEMRVMQTDRAQSVRPPVERDGERSSSRSRRSEQEKRNEMRLKPSPSPGAASDSHRKPLYSTSAQAVSARSNMEMEGVIRNKRTTLQVNKSTFLHTRLLRVSAV